MAKDCCPTWGGWVVLIIGILFLLTDLGINTGFGTTLNWWTLLFIIFGLGMLMKK